MSMCDDHVWWSYMMIIFDEHQIWWSCMIIRCDDHIWWSRMIAVDGHHIWWSYMIIIYDHHIRKNQAAWRQFTSLRLWLLMEVRISPGSLWDPAHLGGWALPRGRCQINSTGPHPGVVPTQARTPARTHLCNCATVHPCTQPCDRKVVHEKQPFSTGMVAFNSKHLLSLLATHVQHTSVHSSGTSNIREAFTITYCNWR